MPFATIDEAIEVVRAGGIVVVVDDEDRENEGDLVMAASAVTPQAVNFMATHGRGLICMSVEGPRLDELQIDRMVPAHGDHAETNFAVSIDLEVPGSTGISAFDRARTIQHVLAPEAVPDDFRRPGHVFPLRYVPGGVLRRARPHRGVGRPGAPGGARPVRRDLRDHERGRVDGSPARPRGVLRGARPAPGHHRRPGRVPPPYRVHRRAGRRRAPADPVRDLAHARLSQRPRRDRARRGPVSATPRASPTCSCACTPSA